MSEERQTGSVAEVFWAFLKLGCLSYGGPVAHLGFFRKEFVQKREWIGDAAFADLVALCQFLPGPSSSQVGFALGYRRAGLVGAFAAWVAFTMPSAVLMIAFAFGMASLGDLTGAGWVAGLKLAAVAVVADAIWNMAPRLCPDRPRALIALGSTALLVVGDAVRWQLVAIAFGVCVGWLLYHRADNHLDLQERVVSRGRGWPWLAVFAALLVTLPWLANALPPDSTVAVVNGFYRAGSLVFGGGHVVLPLLEAFTVDPGWISGSEFLAGYGAAQAVPGPLFTFAAFLGTDIDAGPGGIPGGLLALVAVYLPSWLLVLGVLPYWDKLRSLSAARAALMGANAAVVGLLMAAFYNPIFFVAVTTPLRFAFALTAFALLRYGRAPAWVVVILCGVGGQVLL